MEYLTRKQIAANRATHIYVYSDSYTRPAKEVGLDKICRGQENCFPLTTKLTCCNAQTSYLSDAMFDTISDIWHRQLAAIHEARRGRRVVVISGIGRGHAELPIRAPLLWRKLQLIIQELESINAP